MEEKNHTWESLFGKEDRKEVTSEPTHDLWKTKEDNHGTPEESKAPLRSRLRRTPDDGTGGLEA